MEARTILICRENIDCHPELEVSMMPKRNAQAVWPPLFAQSVCAGIRTTS